MPDKAIATSGPVNELVISYLSLEELRPYRGNPRTHSAKQIGQISRSIQTFGFVNPVLLDRDLGIIAGHGRVEAARKLGMRTVPTVRLDHMTESQKRAYIIADNKLAENAGWDEELLKLEFQYLSDLDIEFDLSVTGFEIPEIDFLLHGDLQEDNGKEPETLDIKLPEQPVARPGDLWQLGPHRLYCGDATKPESFRALMGQDRAAMVFIDPPYNVPIDGHVCGLGAVQHEAFKMASGEMSEAEFTRFLGTVFGNLAGVSRDGAIHFVCMDWRHIGEVNAAGKEVYTELKNLCVWNKNNGGMGSLYRSKHELVFVFKQGRGQHINNVQLGQHGRYRTNVWDYAGVNTFKEERMEELAMHPTVKPVALVADAILDCSNPKDIILDCFGGSGTTLLAAAKTGRTGYLMELDSKYVDVALLRCRESLGLEPVLQETGLSFTEVRKSRLISQEDTHG